MKALSLFALCLFTASTSFAGGMGVKTTIEYIPADEAAMAKMRPPSLRATCQRHVNSAADEWQQRNRFSKAQWETTADKSSFLAARCGNVADFNRELGTELNRRPKTTVHLLYSGQFESVRRANDLKREKQCKGIVDDSVDEMQLNQVNQAQALSGSFQSSHYKSYKLKYEVLGCARHTSFTTAFNTEWRSRPTVVDFVVGTGRSIAAAARSGLERMNLIRPTSSAQSNSHGAKAKSGKASN
ncbi:MAG: hypothetical protein AAB250_16490 [Bdellovibrionota bacterium]